MSTIKLQIFLFSIFILPGAYHEQKEEENTMKKAEARDHGTGREKK